MSSITFSLGTILSIAAALVVITAIIVIVRHAWIYFRNLSCDMGDFKARMDAADKAVEAKIATVVVALLSLDPTLKLDPNLKVEADPTATQEVDKPSVRSRVFKKKRWIILGLACVALAGSQFFIGSGSDSPKVRNHSSKHDKSDSDGKTETSATDSPKADSCGKCKPEMPGGIIDTDPNVGYIFADKCVGDGDCASCKPVGCVGESKNAPPSCTTCSSTGK
jgi:hypothetical protein